MGVDAVRVVVAVVAPLREYLAREGVPIAVQQRLALLLRHGGQAGEVVRVVGKQYLVVEHGGRHEDAGLPARLLVAVREADLELLPDRLHGLGRRDEALLHPAVAHAAGVGLRPDVAAGPRPVGAVSGEQVAVLLPEKLRQLVKVDEVIALALVVGPVLGVLHRAEENLGPGGEGPDVLALVKPGLFVGPSVNLRAAVHQLSELREGLAEDKPTVMRYLHLAQGLGQGAVRFTAARCTAVQCLVLKAGHECRLARLRCPDDFTHRLRLPQSVGLGCPSRGRGAPRRCPRPRRRPGSPACTSTSPASGWSARTWRWWGPAGPPC